MDTYVFAGGGSGGHLFPAIAVARELTRRAAGCRIVFVGSRRPVEGDILSREPFERRVLDAAAASEIARHPLRFAWRHWQARRTAIEWLRAWQPRAVVGCGGYASVPMALAASRVGIPLVLLEQNVVPGRATTWLVRRAQAVCTSFAETAEHLPHGNHVILTGNPVRTEIAALAGRPRAASPTRRTLLVLGGSQGAASVNAAVLRFAEQQRGALEGWRIIHQTGATDEAAVRSRYAELAIEADVSAFIVDMAGAYAAADAVVSRAGGTTLAELACAALPAVLIPYPGAIRDHQLRNAEAFVRAGAACVATHSDTDALAHALLPLLSDGESRRRMSARLSALARPSATQHAADVIHDAGCRI